MDYEVECDGRTVWVNAARGNIARFAPMAMDVHDVDADGFTHGCLCCKKGSPTLVDWSNWRAALETHYGIIVSDGFKPAWLTAEKKPPGTLLDIARRMLHIPTFRMGRSKKRKKKA